MRTTEKFIVLDVETANDTVDALTYDIGFIVADRHGNIYERHSFCVYDIYCCEKDLMQSAYYAHKLPLLLDNFQLSCTIPACHLLDNCHLCCVIPACSST